MFLVPRTIAEIPFLATCDKELKRVANFIFTKGSADVLDHAMTEMATGGKLGIDATKNLPEEGFKRAWPPLIKMDGAVRRKIDALAGQIWSGTMGT